MRAGPDLLFQHFWIALVVVTLIHGRSWWAQAQSRIHDDPSLEPGYRRLYRAYQFWANVPWLLMGASILSGRVRDVSEYLRPASGNPVVLAWYGAMAVLLAGLTWRIVLGDGAETLERHPGVWLFPALSARGIRMFWLGVVAWNILIGAWLLAGFSGSLPASAESWLPVVFPVFFVAMWVGMGFLIAAVGGWRRLAVVYALNGPFEGKRFRFRGGQVGSANYGGCLTLGTNARGLYVSAILLFRSGHPPFFVPWSDVSARATRWWWLRRVELRFAKVPGVPLRVSAKLGHALAAESGGRVTIAPFA